MKTPCPGCLTRCKPCRSVELITFKTLEENRKPLPTDLGLQVSDLDEQVYALRLRLYEIRDQITKKSIAPVGAFLFVNTVKNSAGSLYSYWVVRGEDPDNPKKNRVLGNVQKSNKRMLAYKARLTRRDQVYAIDARINELEKYLSMLPFNMFKASEEFDGEDD